MLTRIKTQPTQRERERGFTLIEMLVALSLLLVISLGLGPLFAVSINSNETNRRQVELLNVARAKLEEIQSIPYDQVGIRPSGPTGSGEGYFETDPLYNATFAAAQDRLLSDTVALTDGLQATRTVTAEAVDDPADATGTNDWDQVMDPNTGTQLDYKYVKVVAETVLPSGLHLRQELVTYLHGTLDSEVDGAQGNDNSAVAPNPPTKLKDKKNDKDKADKDKTGSVGEGHPQPDPGQGKGRKVKSPGTSG